MLEQSLRHYYQRVLVDPLLPYLKHPVTPISVTWFSCLFGVLFIPLLLLNKPLLAVICLLFSGYLDTLDGTLARFQNKTSDFGSVMDIVIDRVVEFSALFAFYLVEPNRALLVILMLGSILLCITSFLVVGIFTPNTSHKSFHYSPGIMERAEAFIFFILMVLCPTYFDFLALLFCVLVCLTAVIRIVEFKNGAMNAGDLSAE